MSDLRERVAWNICERCYPPKCDDLCGECLRQADAAIAIALEEAARVADAFPARTHGALATAPYAAAEQAAEEIAAAIRAMIRKPD